jgi:hypothetical protein
MIECLDELADAGYIQEQQELVAPIVGELRHLRQQGPRKFELFAG